MQRFLLLLLGFAVLLVGFRFRYRFVNIILGNPFIRGLAVSSFFKLPFVREKLLNQVFRYS
ncbi:hypothetical protein [Priestia koreensis]|uniref:Uncharacterized protein n=1 Tax=Priestia koreensis TaxID=284581 RepID=A0A0M0KZ71_9BACI|nr:hypothetical protein [Priestia koreensis]KOO43922.1 hypothetical protein AMD01_14430 [Priestia koreensis]MCM3002476.1 hypothetical protein [Priestia koreensis]UNL84192.1 hypothetical protein IE339_18875 [Priestia koreensis]